MAGAELGGSAGSGSPCCLPVWLLNSRDKSRGVGGHVSSESVCRLTNTDTDPDARMVAVPWLSARYR